MKRNKLTFVAGASLVALALALNPSPVLADDDDRTSGVVEPSVFWFVENDPEDSAKFEQYREVPSGPAMDHFDVQWLKSDKVFDPALYFRIEGWDVAQDDQRIDLTMGKRGLWKGKIYWAENPRRYGDDAHQLHSYDGDGVFSLIDAFQTAVQGGTATGGSNNQGDTAPTDGVWDPGTKGAIMRDALAIAPDIDVEYERRTGGANFEFTPTRSWKFGLSGQRELRDGNKPQSQSFAFTNVVEVAGPVDFQTDTFTAFGEYRRKHWNLGANYTMSDFEIGEDHIVWDNPLFPTDVSASSTSRGRYSLGTDNEMDQWQVYAGANLPGNTRINAIASHTSTSQNDDFLPQTINSMLTQADLALPETSAHAEYDITLYDIRINSRPLDWFRIKGWWRDYEHDNDTPEIVFPSYAETDVAYVDLGRMNLPYSYEKINYGLLAGFSPVDWTELTLSWEREDFERDHAAVEDSREDTWKFSADFDINEHLFLRASYTWQDREADEYHVHYNEESFPEGESVVAPVNVGARKWYWTDRDRDAWSLMAEITPIDKFSIYAEAQVSSADYSDPETGLSIGDSYTVEEDRIAPFGVPETYDIRLAGREDEESSAYTIGFAITPNENWSIHLDHTWEDIDFSMASRYRNVTGGVGQDNPLDDWDSDLEDRYRTFSLGFNGKWADGRWEISGDYTSAQAEGDIFTSFVDGGSASGDTDLVEFPTLDNDYVIAHLSFEHHFPSGWDVGLMYWYEQWEYDDWQMDYNAPFIGNPDQERAAYNWIQLGLDYDDYENHILQFFARYHF